MRDSYIFRSAVRHRSFQLFSYLLFQIERPNGNIVILFLIVNIKLSLNVLGFLVKLAFCLFSFEISVSFFSL